MSNEWPFALADSAPFGKIGETLVSKPHVVRTTRSLIFMSTEVKVDDRCVVMANGVFKILKGPE